MDFVFLFLFYKYYFYVEILRLLEEIIFEPEETVFTLQFIHPISNFVSVSSLNQLNDCIKPK